MGPRRPPQLLDVFGNEIRPSDEVVAIAGFCFATADGEITISSGTALRGDHAAVRRCPSYFAPLATSPAKQRTAFARIISGAA